MRVTLALGLFAILATTGCAVRPDFLPAPARVLDKYTALRQPRPELPVGALWVEGHGPYGTGATADNLETVKTLSALTFDGGVQANLSLGVLQYLDLDPSYSRKMTARLNDVSIVRVKDMTKLAGPAGQPRIYEALKAASITVTASRDIGLSIETAAAQRNLPVLGRGTTGQLTTFTIEAKEAFFAIKVARMTSAESKPAIVRLSRSGDAHTHLAGRRLIVKSVVDRNGCPAKIDALVADREGERDTTVSISKDQPAPLAMPISADRALYDAMKWTPASKAKDCSALQIVLVGTKLEQLDVSSN